MIINGLEVGQVLGFEDSMMLTAETGPRERPLDREGGGRRHHGEEPLAGLPCARLPHRPAVLSRTAHPAGEVPQGVLRQGEGGRGQHPACRRHQERGVHPGHGGGTAGRRIRGEGCSKRGPGRLHRHDQASPRGPGLRQQGPRRRDRTTSLPAPPATTAWAPGPAASTGCSARPSPTSSRRPQRRRYWSSAAAPAGWKPPGCRPCAATT